MNLEFIFVVFVFGVVAIVAIAHRESHLAEKALDSIDKLWQRIISSVYEKR